MVQKRAILDALPRAALLELVDAFELEVADRGVRDELLNALAASKKARLDSILEGLPRAALKDICRALGLSQSGKEKSVIIDRIVSGGTTIPAQAALPATDH